MAENEDRAEEKKSKGSYTMLVVALIAAAAAGGGGYFYMSKMAGSEAAPVKEGHEKKGAAEENVRQILPLDTFVVNLTDPSKTRYLKIAIQVEFSRTSAMDEAKAKMPQIRDAMIILLSSKSMEEIQTAEGKYQLRDEVISRINQFMTKGKATAAYFTDLVVQ